MNSKMLMLAAVPSLVWIGFVYYAWSIDRKISDREAEKERDEL